MTWNTGLQANEDYLTSLRSERRRIVILAGQTFLGVRYFVDTPFDVSPNWAEHLLAYGIAKCAS
jgi:hypothetical protein